MKKHSNRTALRFPEDQKLKIEALFKTGIYKSRSEIIRVALEEFLEKILSPEAKKQAKRDVMIKRIQEFFIKEPLFEGIAPWKLQELCKSALYGDAKQ